MRRHRRRSRRPPWRRSGRRAARRAARLSQSWRTRPLTLRCRRPACTAARGSCGSRRSDAPLPRGRARRARRPAYETVVVVGEMRLCHAVERDERGTQRTKCAEDAALVAVVGPHHSVDVLAAPMGAYPACLQRKRGGGRCARGRRAALGRRARGLWRGRRACVRAPTAAAVRVRGSRCWRNPPTARIRSARSTARTRRRSSRSAARQCRTRCSAPWLRDVSVRAPRRRRVVPVAA